MGKGDEKLLAELRVCETRVWRALVEGDMSADAASLDNDFLGVYSDGFAKKPDHVQQLEDGPTIDSFELSECRLMQLGQDYVLFSYRADFQKRTKTASEAMYVSSIWRRTDKGWINVFSQDTPASA